jgi:hypothetical protein
VCLYTLFDQDHDSVFFSFWSIKSAMLQASMLGDYSTSESSTPSYFPRRTDLLGNLFLITSLLDLLFLLFFFFGPRTITTHGRIRRLPHQGVRHSIVDHGFPSDGVFLLLHLWVLPSRWTIYLRRSPSSLSSLWMASWCEWLSPCRMVAPPGF